MAARLSTPTTLAGVRMRRQSPEPGRLWIRYRPADWPTSEGPWCDLGEGGVGAATTCRGRLAALLPVGPVDDRVYLPPVPKERAIERNDLALELATAGNALLVHLLPGEEAPEGLAVAVDLLHPLLTGGLEVLSSVPRGSLPVWPLIPGVTTRPRTLEEGLGRLAAAGASRVFGLEISLDPGERRRLAAQRDPEAFAALFHGGPAGERAFAAAARASGLEPFVDRPEIPGPWRSNRRAAGVLAAVADLWLRLDRPAGRGQVYLRAARWADRIERDLSALWREGNLRVLEWVDPEVDTVLDELFRTGGSSLLRELRDEFAAKPGLP